jgi:pimeloyl-ACP methyl ester carboxylesterase
VFVDEEFNYIFQILLGSVYYRVAEVGTCLAIAEQIVDGDPASAFKACIVAGDRLSGIAQKAEAAGRRVSARQAYMQASNYVFSATHFINPISAPDGFAVNWLHHQELWDKGAALLDPPVESLSVPYEKGTLPGYFFRVDASNKSRPLLIFNNGVDSSMLSAWTLGIAPGLERGYNVFAFYGPGQGSALLQQKLYFRPDWEKVITPIIDYISMRREIDLKRIALLGTGQGGYWAARAAAFEPRIAACVSDPGVWDVSVAWTRSLSSSQLGLLAAGQQDQFDRALHLDLKSRPRAAAALVSRMRPFGLTSPYEAFSAVQQYKLADVADRIRCPVLLTDPEGEQFWPGQSQQLYAALQAPKTLLKFTASEGADLHCEPKALGLRAERIFDWLDQTLKV